MEFDQAWWIFLVRWLHVMSGIMWIGLLWYFNFVQIPTMPKVPASWGRVVFTGAFCTSTARG